MTRDKFNSIPPVERTHKGKKIREIVSSPSWPVFIEDLQNLPSKVGIVPAGMEGRADLVSNAAYGTPDYGWLICAANGISDPLEQLEAGKQIIIPIIS